MALLRPAPPRSSIIRAVDRAHGHEAERPGGPAEEVRLRGVAVRATGTGKEVTTEPVPVLVFVYGTLTDPGQVERVLDDYRFEGPATLDGLHRVGGRYPTLAPGGSVDGQLLGTPEVADLDAYEGVDRGLYVRVSVPLADGSGEAAVYVGDPDRLDAPASWPGDGSFDERVREYVSGEVVVRPDDR